MAGTKTQGAPAYDDDELTQADLDALKTLETDNTPPPPDEGEPPAPGEPPAAEPPAPAPAPAAEPAAGDPPAPAAPDPGFQSWLDKHKDKTPEQLAELAYNQEKRAQREGFRARTGGTAAQAAQALADRKADIERRRTEFNEQLEADPDAAAKRLHDERLDEELQDAEAAVQSARIDDAIDFAATYIPDFQNTAPDILSFGSEVGYTEQELNGISDGRDLVVLNLARLAGNLIKGGIIDVKGHFLKAPEPVAETLTDPRLTAPDAPKTLGTAPARPSGGASNLVQRLEFYNNMSDAELDAMTPAQTAELEDLQRQAMNG